MMNTRDGMKPTFDDYAHCAATGAVIAKRSTLYEDIHFWSTYSLGMAFLASLEKERTEGEAFRTRKLAELVTA